MSKSRSGLFLGTGGANAFNSAAGEEKEDPKAQEQVKSAANEEGTIEKAFERAKEVFPTDKDGKFGKKGKSSGVRVIECENQYEDARKFYEIVSEGGEKKIWQMEKGNKLNLMMGQ